jgi:glycerol kinase
MPHILAIDQGTTSSRSILFDARLRVVSSAQEEFPQHFPASGWVEHVPSDLMSTVLRTAKSAISTSGITVDRIAAIGITNQRETTILWDRATGEPLCNAVVWQDRRTTALCNALKDTGHEPMITARTGLLLDPYFSGTKISWMLEAIPGARESAKRGEIAFGTVDSFLIWKLTGGKVHATDATNASRTLLYNIVKGIWDADICALLDIPMEILPEIRDSASFFGTTSPEIFGRQIPILGVAGDQQAATVGQACFSPGMMKATFGTGCFALLNTGSEMVLSRHRLLTTIAYQLDGKPTYALEGSIFMAGAVVQWLRDGLQIIQSTADAGSLAEGADPAQDIIVVPAFTGLGAPYWQPDCRGAIFGLTRNTGPSELAKAALESVGFQTRDLLEAMCADWGTAATGVLRVDGGLSASNVAMQFLADILGTPANRAAVRETTALGVAYLAGLKAGLCPAPDEFQRTWDVERQFLPAMPEITRERKFNRWKRAVAATISAVSEK